MGSARDRYVRQILDELEKTLIDTIPVAFRRSPETLFREIASLNLVIDLKERLAKRNYREE
ncbi:MAG: hypothetical protein E6K95_01805 [Thaumarchaeota archaeon]|nr:MAG: hypothetical protein E6K95_01805 [Nitrososphaerota archaeon]